LLLGFQPSDLSPNGGVCPTQAFRERATGFQAATLVEEQLVGGGDEMLAELPRLLASAFYVQLYLTRRDIHRLIPPHLQ
jgi:hypothetical protein